MSHHWDEDEYEEVESNKWGVIALVVFIVCLTSYEITKSYFEYQINIAKVQNGCK